MAEDKRANQTYHTSSGRDDYLTPVPYVKAAREVLVEIDLDPASCAFAQQEIKAKRWFGPGSPYSENGLKADWAGRVLLNPPGGYAPIGSETRSMANHWYLRLARFWGLGAVDAAIFVGFNIEIVRSGQIAGELSPAHFSMCFPAKRIPFDIECDGFRSTTTSPTHGCVIVCLTDQLDMADRFSMMFERFGDVIVPMRLTARRRSR